METEQLARRVTVPAAPGFSVWEYDVGEDGLVEVSEAQLLPVIAWVVNDKLAPTPVTLFGPCLGEYAVLGPDGGIFDPSIPDDRFRDFTEWRECVRQ